MQDYGCDTPPENSSEITKRLLNGIISPLASACTTEQKKIM